MKRRAFMRYPRPEIAKASDVCDGWLVHTNDRWREVTGGFWSMHGDTVVLEIDEYSRQHFAPGQPLLVRKMRDVFQRQIGPSRVTYDDSEGPEDYRTVTFRWRCIAGATPAEVYRAACASFNTHCHHSYDCCGNVYYNVSAVRHVGGREWLIRVRGCRNV